MFWISSRSAARDLSSGCRILLIPSKLVLAGNAGLQFHAPAFDADAVFNFVAALVLKILRLLLDEALENTGARAVVPWPNASDVSAFITYKPRFLAARPVFPGEELAA